MTEQMTYGEYLNLVAQAMIEQEDFGRMGPETRRQVQAIKDGEIEVMDEGWIRPLEDRT
jgi:hypothetical protein